METDEKTIFTKEEVEAMLMQQAQAMNVHQPKIVSCVMHVIFDNGAMETHSAHDEEGLNINIMGNTTLRKQAEQEAAFAAQQSSQEEEEASPETDA